MYDVGEKKSRFSTKEKRDGNSLASFSFYNRGMFDPILYEFAGTDAV